LVDHKQSPPPSPTASRPRPSRPWPSHRRHGIAGTAAAVVVATDAAAVVVSVVSVVVGKESPPTTLQTFGDVSGTFGDVRRRPAGERIGVRRRHLRR
jgi:hypothetical protein